jgi:ABC-type uncharacterized transport system involved in gliding motility auxiliary subunit
MRTEKSFFKREAVFTVLFQIVLPLLGLLFVLVIYLWRWASR